MVEIATLQNRWKSQSKSEKITWLFWGLAACLIIYKCVSDPTGRSVVYNYLDAANLWNHRELIYFGNHGYLYLPQFAFLLSFITHLPQWLVESLERLIQLSLLLVGLYSFSQLIRKEGEESFFPLLSFIVFFMGFASFRNGQANIAILGFMLLSVVALSQNRWNFAAIFMSLGLVIKPTFIVFYLVAGALHRPMYWRLALGLLAAVLIPIAFAGSTYVLEQYIGFLNTLQSAVNLGVNKADWASFFGIFPQVFDRFIPHSTQTIIRLIFAPLTLGLVWYVKKHTSTAMGVYAMYALPACYLMLFNPRSENNDYVIMSVALGFWLAIATYRINSKVLSAFCGIIFLGIINAYKLSILLIPHMDAWISPIMGTLFTVFLVARLIKETQ